MVLDGADDRDIFYGMISDDAYNGNTRHRLCPPATDLLSLRNFFDPTMVDGCTPPL